MSAPVEPAVGLRSRVVGGFAWKVLSMTVRQGARVVVAVILARLLTPHDYGLAGMVLVFSTLGLALSDLSFGAALVQRRELSEQDRSTVFWTSAAIGAVFTLLGIALSPLLADFYGEPEVEPLFAVLSLVFLISSLGTTQIALMTREMAFRQLELRLIAANLAGAAVGIVVAAQGFGPWAIIAMQLTAAGISTCFLWAVSWWHPKLTYSRASLRELGGYSANVFGTNFLFYLNRYTDNLLIGRFLGAAALGVYALAYNLMLVPAKGIATPIRELLFPAFARMQDDLGRMANAWLRVEKLVVAILMPALLGLMVVAADFVQVVLGSRWSAATPVIQLLAWVGLVQSLGQLNASVLQACNRTRVLLRFAVGSFVVTTASFIVGLHWGVVGVAASYAVITTIIQPFYALITARAVEISLLTLVRSLAGVVQAALLMTAFVLAGRLFMLHHEVPAAGRLAALTIAGALVYLACLVWRAPEVITELRNLRGASRQPAQPATVPAG